MRVDTTLLVNGMLAAIASYMVVKNIPYYGWVIAAIVLLELIKLGADARNKNT